MIKTVIHLHINNELREATVSSEMVLSELLREEFHLKGTRSGCGDDMCRACTVLLNDEPVLSCILPAVEADGCRVTTIEGIRVDGKPHPLEQAFVHYGAISCGFCTPGQIMQAYALIQKNPNPSITEIKRALKGHICYCEGYRKIWEAVTHWQDFVDVQETEKLPRWVML